MFNVKLLYYGLRIGLITTGLFGLSPSVFGTLRFDQIFTDNMVIQRNKPIYFYGKAVPGETITVQFNTLIKSSIVQHDSTWQIRFPAMKAMTRPLMATAYSRHETLRLKNILIGDVWLCSGQSNMEWPLEKETHFKDEKNAANQELIRFNNPHPVGRNIYGVPYTTEQLKRLNNEYFYKFSKWLVSDSNTVRQQSAIAYYFAKKIVAKTGIPIGIINLSIGGAPIETFISPEVMSNNKGFAQKVSPGDWLENNSLPVWIRERGKQNLGSHTDAPQDDLGKNHAYKPGFAYRSSIPTLSRFPIKGVLWYQGESNAQELERVEEYGRLFELMVSSYRAAWKNSKMPFYWVQLSSIDSLHYKSQLWPQFRNIQRESLQNLKHGGMAVTSDIGNRNDVHPTDKKTVGERLARWALLQEYGKNIIPSGPLPKKAKYKRNKVILSFDYAKALSTADSRILRGFSLDGLTECKAFISGSTITIPSKVKPTYVYYGWKPYTDANLVNQENLPGSTFKIRVN